MFYFRYYLIEENVHNIFKELQTYVKEAPELSGENFKNKVIELEAKWGQLSSTNKWVGCQGSEPTLRGYTCGLWTLFHFLTVQAAEMNITNNPLETLEAIHGYVQFFFGCSECSQHFQSMAAEHNIWNVSSKDDAVIWLWKAHNKVNERIKGDNTEDPMFPKIQFPCEAACKQCRKPTNEEWNENEVLFFLKKMHLIQNLNRNDILEVELQTTKATLEL